MMTQAGYSSSLSFVVELYANPPSELSFPIVFKLAGLPRQIIMVKHPQFVPTHVVINNPNLHSVSHPVVDFDTFASSQAPTSFNFGRAAVVH